MSSLACWSRVADGGWDTALSPLLSQLGSSPGMGSVSSSLRFLKKDGAAMMRRSILSLALVLLAGSAPAADELKSGPQVGEGVPAGFSALFLNADHAGTK